jgi:G3E family GTPase
MTSETMNGHKDIGSSDLLPVTLLCGFLGAGKTTLLKHILETKHAEGGKEGFRCAILVNDMASLNIDKSLIEQSSLKQTDEVIAMQNGCFCCTLQSDFVEQIKELCTKQTFDYMLIEASGVSEPSQIAPLFDLCDDEHDHENEHPEGPQLGEVARLDTCVTVVDAAEFHRNLGSVKHYENGEIQGTIAELMMEQVEYSNVIVLNKQDLVTEDQEQDILDRLAVINPNANVVKSTHGQINVMDILNTYRFKRDEVGVDSVVLKAIRAEPEPKEAEPACCTKSVSEGKVRCCKKKAKKLFDSGLSQVLLGVVPANDRQKQLTRHEKRFGITSFVYRARRPFHPGRIHDLLMDPYFVCSEVKADLDVLQKNAKAKQVKRAEFMGELLRSKGFMWIASSHWVMGGWQQAGNILRISAEAPWMCEAREFWEGTPAEPEVLKDMTQENGELYPHGDRRQELVFIGVGLKHEAIQNTLDQCLLNDEEMKMHPDQWEQTMMDEDRIRLTLEEKPR